MEPVDNDVDNLCITLPCRLETACAGLWITRSVHCVFNTCAVWLAVPGTAELSTGCAYAVDNRSIVHRLSTGSAPFGARCYHIRPPCRSPVPAPVCRSCGCSGCRCGSSVSRAPRAWRQSDKPNGRNGTMQQSSDSRAEQGQQRERQEQRERFIASREQERTDAADAAERLYQSGSASALLERQRNERAEQRERHDAELAELVELRKRQTDELAACDADPGGLCPADCSCPVRPSLDERTERQLLEPEIPCDSCCDALADALLERRELLRERDSWRDGFVRKVARKAELRTELETVREQLRAAELETVDRAARLERAELELSQLRQRAPLLDPRDAVRCEDCSGLTVPTDLDSDHDGFGWSCIDVSCPAGREQLGEPDRHSWELYGLPASLAAGLSASLSALAERLELEQGQ